MASIELWVDEADGVETVAVVMRGASVIEYEGELVPAVRMTPEHARSMASALIQCAERINAYGS